MKNFIVRLTGTRAVITGLISLTILLSLGFLVTSPARMESARARTAAAFFQDTDLGVTKTVNFGTATPGANLTYTITVVNGGPDAGINSALNDPLPSAVTFVSVAAPAGWNCTSPTVGANGAVNCTNPSFAVSAGVVFTLVVKVDPAAVAGTFIDNIATISTDTPDVNEENNSSTASTQVVGMSADLGVTKVANTDSAFADTNVTYTITVVNSGPDSAANAVMNDPLPGGMTFVSLVSPGGWSCTNPGAGNTGTVNCTNPSVPMTAGQVFTLVGHIPPATPAGSTFSNKATVTTTTMDPNSENDQSIATTTVVSCFTGVGVTTNADSGAGSLRQAIADTCTSGTIGFDMTKVVSPITLTSAELLIDKDLTILGPDVPLTITRSGGAPAFRLFRIAPSRTVSISSLTLTNGQGGSGGAIFNAGTLTLTNATLTGNSPGIGGGLYNEAGSTLNLINSTVTGNTAGIGAGLFVSATSTANLTNVTISGNNGAGIDNSGGVVNIRNTIVAANTAGQNDVNSGVFTSQGHNLIGASPGSNGFTNGVNGDKVGTIASPISPLLAALGNYGGPTQTYALLPGSPAIDAGDNCVFTNSCSPALGLSLSYDQRGAGFVRQVGTNVDIGAFESRGFNIAATSGTPQSATITSAFSAPLVATISSSFGEPVGGGLVTFTAPGSGASGSFPGPVTSVTVSANGGGVATSPTFTANSTPGSYNVIASLSAPPASANFALTNTKAPTSTAVTTSPNPSSVNQSVTFTATVTSSFGTPTGTVQFKDNGANVGAPVALVSGVATTSTSTLTVGATPSLPTTAATAPSWRAPARPRRIRL